MPTHPKLSTLLSVLALWLCGLFFSPPMFSKLLVDEDGEVVVGDAGGDESFVLSFVVKLRRSGILCFS